AGDAKPNQRAQARRDFALVAGPNPNRNALAQQVRGRLEVLLKEELSFAIRAAKLNDEDRRTFVTASKKWFDEFASDFVQNMDSARDQMWLQGFVVVGAQQSVKDPRNQIQEGVRQTADAVLTKEQAAAYLSECDERTAFSRRAAVENLVKAIDAKLTLSSE